MREGWLVGLSIIFTAIYVVYFFFAGMLADYIFDATQPGGSKKAWAFTFGGPLIPVGILWLAWWAVQVLL